MALCKISGPPTLDTTNVWPDVIFNLLKPEEQRNLINRRRNLEQQTTGVPPLHISRLPQHHNPYLVLIDPNVNDSKWHKNRYALSNTKYSYESSVGLPGCVKNNMFSVDYNIDIPATVPTNRAGKDSYVVIKQDDTRTFEKLLFDCKNTGGESLSLEEYVKRQEKIIQNYEESKNLTLTEIAAVLNAHNRTNPAKIDKIMHDLANATYRNIIDIIAGIVVAPPNTFNSEDAISQIRMICSFPQNKQGRFRLPNFSSFIDLVNTPSEDLRELHL